MAWVIDGPHQDFAMRVIDARRKTNLTQEQLAASIGISKRNISSYENGHSFPRGGTIQALAKILDVDPMWLATGNTAAGREFLAEQARSLPAGLPERVEMIFIEKWHDVGTSRVPLYNPDPKGGWESPDITKFTPVVKTFFDKYMATRFPGTLPPYPGYPAGAVLILDTRMTTCSSIENGVDIVFRIRGEGREPGLRRFIREPGMPTGMLFPISSNTFTNPIPFDETEIDVVGIVISIIISKQTH